MPLTSPSIAFRPRELAVALLVLTALMIVVTPTTAQAQEFTTTTAVAETVPTTVADTVTGTETQTRVEAEPQPDRFLTSESRRIVVAIGGLVAVALMLMLLTVRYWRQTKPMPPGADQLAPIEPAAEESPVAGRRSRRAVAGADHGTVDESWEPLATGEHAVVDLPDPGPRPRPSVEVRRKVLDRT